MIEAGSHLASAFLQQDLVDEIVYYQASKLLGNTARGAFLLPENDNVLRQNPAWQTISLDRVGDDIKWVLQKR